MALASSFLLLTLPFFPQGGPPPAKVSVVKAVTHAFTPRAEALGEVEAIRSAEVGTEVEGLVEDRVVDEGAVVTAGQLVLRLRTEALDIARRAAEAELQVAKLQLDEYRAGSRPEEIEAAEKAVADAKAWLIEAEAELERQKGLQGSGVGSIKALATAQAQADSRRATLEAAQARLDLVRKGPREEVVARAASQMVQKQAELDAILDNLARARITAPFAGVVTRKPVEKGSYVRRGDSLLAMVQLDPIRIAVNVPERLIANVVPGSKLTVVLDALPDESLQAEVTAIVPSADRLARTFPVKLTLANPAHRLLPGMVARAWIPAAPPRDGIGVPRDAIVAGPTGSVVYKVAAGAAVLVPVRVGLRDGLLVEVLGELAAGDLVVVRGNEGLRPGQPVVVVDDAPPGSGVKEAKTAKDPAR